MSLTTDYNKARLAANAQGQNLSFADFQKTYNPAAGTATLNKPAPSLAAATPTPNMAGTPTTITSPIQRNFEREQAAIKKLGANPLTIGNLNPKSLFEMTYTPQELSNLEDYQAIIQRNQAKTNLASTPLPTNTMMGVLEEALRTKSDVGNQRLGVSQLYEAAGIPTTGVSGYATLMQSLAQRGNEMKDRYGSFVNQLSRVGGFLKDNYDTTAARYKTLNDDYQLQVTRMQNLTDNIIKQEQAMSLLERQNELEKERIKYSWDVEHDNIENDPAIAPAYDLTGIKDLGGGLSYIRDDGTKGLLGENCVKYARYGGFLPFGLTTKEDKKAAVEKYGIINDGNSMIQGLQVGDSILTADGTWGHAARVASIDRANNTFTVEEANFIPGKITKGRQINLNDISQSSKIFGYIKNGGPEGWRGGEPIVNKDGLDIEGENPAVTVQVQEAQSNQNLPLDIYTQRLARANAGVSTQKRTSNMEAYKTALKTKNPENVELALLEIEREKFLPRSQDILTNFNKDVKDWKEIQTKYNVMVSAYKQYEKDPKALVAVDQALINMFNKITDPQSVVRETEFDRTGKSLGIEDRVLGAAVKAIKGGAGLTDETREAIIRVAKAIADGASASFESARTVAERQAEVAGVPQDFIYKSLGLDETGKYPTISIEENYNIGDIVKVKDQRWIYVGNDSWEQLK